MEIRVQLEGQTLRVRTGRSRGYASNSEIFLLWMIGSSLVIVTIAVLFLRNNSLKLSELGPLDSRADTGVLLTVPSIR